MSIYNFVYNSEHGDDYIDDSDPVTLIKVIFSREVLPDVRSAYATISSEESYRVVAGSIMFKIIVYPVHFEKKKSGQNVKGKNISNNNFVGSSSSFGFTDEQMATLISLIKDNKIRKNVQANMTDTNMNNDQNPQSDSSSSSVSSGSDVDNADFPVVNPENDAYSSDDIVATQNEEVASIEENLFFKGNLDQNPSTSQGVQHVRRSFRQSVFPRSYNDFVVESKVKYGLEKYVDYPKMDALLRNGTWSSGEIDRYKARLVAQGFGQKEDYGMLACKPAKTPLMSKLVISNEASDNNPILDNITDYQKLMGKIIYLSNTRPDISYVVHCLSQFILSPLKSHLKIAFKILRYLKSCPGVRKTIKVDSANQIADILTKDLDIVQHKKLVEKLEKIETKDTLSSCSDSKEQKMQQIQEKAKKSCMLSFQQLHSHLKLLSNNDFKGTRTADGFKRAFATLFRQDVEIFTGTLFLSVDKLEKQLDKEEFQEIGSMAAFRILETHF
nr:ribonuclease H-like domain-containing protein [Tanacetum cinerariifolium]